MTRHGLSHAGATLVTVLVAPLIVEVLRSRLPAAISFTERAAGLLLNNFTLGRHLTPTTLAVLLVAATLAFIWGLAFAIANR